MPTRHKGPAAEVRALNAFIKLMRATDTLARSLRVPATYHLSDGQFAVLEALMHLGPLSQSELAGKLLCSGANVAEVAANLQRMGLVERARDKADQRRVSVSLSARGRRLIEKIFPYHARAVTDLFGVLTPSEQEELGRLCKKLGASSYALRSLAHARSV